MKRGYIVKKKGSDTESDSEQDYSEGPSSSYCRPVQYSGLSQTGYKKPNSGTRQDNLSRDDILERLENYIPLKTMKEKQLLTQLPIFKTWVRYYNTTTKQFRTGGLLMKVEYPDYIMLVNTAKKITWSVQLQNNIIYVQDPKIKKQKEKENEKEIAIKEKLFDMYKNGKLTTRK